jgi:hypothetical protein
LPDDEGGDGVAHERIGPAGVARRLRALQRREVELVAEIVEEEKTVVRVGFEDARAVQAGLGDQAGDVDERPHVLLRRRRVHDDDAAAALEVGAQVAAKARVARRRPEAGDDQAARRGDRGEPGGEGVPARRVGPGNRGRQGGRIQGRRRSAFEVRAREPRG